MADPTPTWLLLGGGNAAVLMAAGATAAAVRIARRWSDLGLGALAWILTVAAKAGLAYMTIPAVTRICGGHIPLAVQIPLFGLLTGVTECGLALPLVLLTARRWRTLESGLAFGAGFGVAESLVLGAPMTLGAIVMLIAPSLAQDAGAQPPDLWRGPEFALERLCAGLVHILAGLLIVESVRRRRWRLFAYAFLLKSAMDAVPTGGELPRWSVEAIYTAFGACSAAATALMWTHARAALPAPPSTRPDTMPA